MSRSTIFHAFHTFSARADQRGYSLVEFMVGAVLLSIAGMATVGVVMNMAGQNAKAQTQSRALALQSELIGALARPETFASTSQLNTMRAVAQGTGTAFVSIDNLNVKSVGGQTIAISGQRVGLDRNFNPCDPTQPSCPLRVDLSMRCSGNLGCSAAYRVTVSDQANPVASAAYGAPMRALASGGTP